uniref:ApaG domain-containing protein n=2 Tax=Chlamydomonas leiostraca TaxID=1034604 RepID=A0A7S0RQF4_9CHLO|mmetsp:Transcript_28510/g.72545  ORF Transcript_28510/g.72545 Transcript_28510/m.72545 type:complete len:259 (+) Transcript_28510:129-905(+)|eukprot:CAMPEP_0202866292 /NCGR_PEP_ID=MMETSP1391-20130828/7305_1 /ASSEMBLY_ACC=CAM_ASM_000867 /TAXON_ID=1034604 /ORGANISM="Chlamydomonas leiostraca, Strain SAG 11-49" /LENGTH=258 /DNA_ID=CAMNT_0049546225 /DNA_START=108 /DNA_END=884 /DNA_ORIENTATION=+
MSASRPATSLAVLRVYRACHRALKGLGPAPLNGGIHGDWGTYSHIASLQGEQSSLISQLFPYVPQDLSPNDPSQYRSCIRSCFKQHAGEQDLAAQAQRLDEAFAALRVLAEQRYLACCSSSCTTDGVRVDVTSGYHRKATHVNGQPVQLFTYRVRVTNTRQQPIKVLGRSWTIMDRSGTIITRIPLAENAIVGQRPVIPPGSTFEYFSGTDLADPPGKQSGSLLISVHGNGHDKPATMSITAEIAPFPLELPASHSSS